MERMILLFIFSEEKIVEGGNRGRYSKNKKAARRPPLRLHHEFEIRSDTPHPAGR